MPEDHPGVIGQSRFVIQVGSIAYQQDPFEGGTVASQQPA